MLTKFNRSLKNLYHGKKGITGLETAIILIAFVTVAAVLAYTVLSAGIFSSERGKEAVYSGLNAAQSTMAVKGSVIATDLATTTPQFTFTLALAIPGSSVDLTKLVYNYYDKNVLHNGNTAVGTITYGGGSTSLSGSEQVLVTIHLAAITALVAYDTFTLEIVPPTGATITVQRTLPGDISGLVSLN